MRTQAISPRSMRLRMDGSGAASAWQPEPRSTVETRLRSSRSPPLSIGANGFGELIERTIWNDHRHHVFEGFGDEVHWLLPLFVVRCVAVRVSFFGLVVDGTAFYVIAAAASGEVTSTSIGMSFRYADSFRGRSVAVV